MSPVSDATADVDASLAHLQDVLTRISDADRHLATPGGGWTVAQVVSHISVSALVWLGNMERLRRDPDLRFFFREEVGHDALGYPPPSVDLAVRRVDSTRSTLALCLPVTQEVAGRSVEIPDLGTMTVAEWTPLIVGHLQSHVAQAEDILRSRDAHPDGA